MPRPSSSSSSLSRCASLFNFPAIASTSTHPVLDFLVPSLHPAAGTVRTRGRRQQVRSVSHTSHQRRQQSSSSNAFDGFFFDALSRAATTSCPLRRPPSRFKHTRQSESRISLSTTAVASKEQDLKQRKNAREEVREKEKEDWEYETYAEISPRHEVDFRNTRLDVDLGGIDLFHASHSTRRFAAASTLPKDFFIDIYNLQNNLHPPDPPQPHPAWSDHSDLLVESTESHHIGAQVKLLQSVRHLELKLANAKAKLDAAVNRPSPLSHPSHLNDEAKEMILTTEDYKGLVDLYYYTSARRSGPDTPDQSPTPLLLQDYAFKLSEDFAPPEAFAKYYADDENYHSPLHAIESALRRKQLREIAVMQTFVDLLLDDRSSNRALHEAYLRLPSPGVAYLPTGVIRLFLQRMSTPWTKSETAMLRYLALIDDMQVANLPISKSEWSSAIYLAGRSFPKVQEADMQAAFAIWRRMEDEAGVKATHVTFNILFDIAVRAGKYPVAQGILKEMHNRGLRLNRLGRVSMIYYHGLRGDGDGVRAAYRNFVDAGEIVDTLVLNCVIASLMNAQEPTAAELVYERMKDLQTRYKLKQRPEGSDTLYLRYPHHGHGGIIDQELASNSLGRVLLRASRLKQVLLDHHSHLQSIMPLTPDHVTFRTMISYHANVSGNLDRLTVLMNEMVEVFNIPFRSVNFQLLFKGFALHGQTGDPHCTWNFRRLELAWDACRHAIKNGQAVTLSPTLSTIKEIEEIDPASESNIIKNLPQRRKLTAWNDFVVDLAVFPSPRRRDIERVHAQLFDEDIVHSKEFSSPFFQQGSSTTDTQATYYPLGLGHTNLDHEEGEYTLPSPAETVAPQDPNRLDPSADAENVTNYNNEASESTDQAYDNDKAPPLLTNKIHATRPLICWLLRAYTRCSGKRAKVEEIWNSARKIWRPHDENEKQSVYRVLRRCLRDCDANTTYRL